MYRRVISRDTIDSLIGANLKSFRSYEADTENPNEDFDWTRIEETGADNGEPVNDELRRHGLCGLVERIVEIMDAIFY
jgi:hypothetical protein